MPYPRASTSICSGATPGCVRRIRPAGVDRFRVVSNQICLLRLDVSPDGESLSFASPKESNQRKGDPDVPVAARLPCDARTLRRLRNSSSQFSTVTTQTVLGDIPSESCASRRAHGDPEKARSPCSRSVINQKDNEASLLRWLEPVGPAEKRRRDGGRPLRMSERTQPELRERVPRRPVPASIAG